MTARWRRALWQQFKMLALKHHRRRQGEEVGKAAEQGECWLSNSCSLPSTDCICLDSLANRRLMPSPLKAKLLKQQDEVAKGVLKVEKKQKESIVPKVKEEKEDKACLKEGFPSSDSSFFTLRNSQTEANPTSSQTLAQSPVQHPFPAPPPQFFIKPCFPPRAPTQSPQFGQRPVANWV